MEFSKAGKLREKINPTKENKKVHFFFSNRCGDKSNTMPLLALVNIRRPTWKNGQSPSKLHR